MTLLDMHLHTPQGILLTGLTGSIVIFFRFVLTANGYPDEGKPGNGAPWLLLSLCCLALTLLLAFSALKSWCPLLLCDK